MKHMILGFSSDWFIDPETLATVKDSLHLIKEFYASDGVVEHYATPIRALIDEPAKEVYSFPFLSEKYCELLLDEVRELHFTPNPNEDALRQIPEVVLRDKLPLAWHALNDVVNTIVKPIIWELWGTFIHDAHIQVANYNVRDKRQGAWHHDQDSDITIVVPLNTGNYSGGGTEFWGRGIVEPLPTGHALIFPSLTHMHRGLPVDSGDRFLLVFWLKARHGQEEN